MKNLTLTILFVLFFFICNFAQTPTPTPSANDENDVVKVSTSIVQLDAVVTDKKGNPVNNLTAEDFEILQDGKPQKITNFSYISRIIDSTATEHTLVPKQDKKNQVPPVSFRPKEIGRVITFIVDDDISSFSGIEAAKAGLEKFVKEQMLPTDVVAIYQTRGGSSLLQQYTSDKSRLLQIIKKIRWFPSKGIGGVNDGDYETIQNNASEKEQDKKQREAIEELRKNKNVTGIFGVIKYAINGLKQTGGRKIIFLLSDSLPLISTREEGMTLSDSYSLANDLVEFANRSSVTINTIDSRGLTNPSIIDASSDIEGIARKDGQTLTSTLLARRTQEDNRRRSGLAYLANETGGKFYENMNFLDVPIKKVLDSEKGYYLLAYEPDDETFNGKKFHKIQIKLKRDDLVVNSRSGFYGITDEEIRPKPRTENGELYNALTAPLPNADLNIRLSAYFANNPNKGNFIHALLYIDGKDITFLDEPGNTKKVVFDIVAVTLSEKNEVIDDKNQTATVHIPLDKVEDVRRDGLIYSIDVPVKKDGTYTFRTALRDQAAKRLGSSSQIIDVPNLSKNRLLMSGLMVSGVDSNGNLLPTESGDRAFSSVVSPSIAAIRQFKRNSVVAYTYTLYNAKPDTASNLPKLTVQTNLYYDGKMFSEGQPQPAEIGKQPDLNRINDFGYLKLNSEIPKGDYVLQIIIKDLTTNQITSQWIDFEVVE